MSAYNAERYIEPCIQSLLNQTFQDFELLIINDGSTDQTEAICRSFTDPRIQLHNNDQNRGLIYSLNKGISLAAAPLIARMDSDDIAFKFRLESQVAYMDAHPEVNVLSSWMIPVDINGKALRNFTRLPVEPAYLSWALLFKNPIANPASMFRKDFVQHLGGYREGFPVAQDYELWSRANRLSPIHVLPEYLVLYRVHNTNIGVARRTEQDNKAAFIAQENMSILLEQAVSLEDVEVLFYAGKGYLTDATLSSASRALSLLVRLYECYCQIALNALDSNTKAKTLGYIQNDMRFMLRQLLLSVSQQDRHRLVAVHPVAQELMTLSLYSHLFFDWRTLIGRWLDKPLVRVALAGQV